MFGEEAVCSSFKAVHKEHLERGNILKPENVTVSQEICRFRKDRRSVCSLAWPPRTWECFSLLDISFLPLPDWVIGLLLVLLHEESGRVVKFSPPHPAPK